ncbi:MAG: hypothetical protein LUF29_05385 [Oscillospiraceae bacterium]|nr:hypothetical protein [Oscillospiraceae bacterium]
MKTTVEKLSDAIGMFSDRILQEADAMRGRKRANKAAIRFVAIAACLAVVVLTGVAYLNRDVELPVEPVEPDVTEELITPDEPVIEEEEPITEENETYTTEILEENGTGVVTSYEDLCDYLSGYNNLQFITFEIVSVYSSEEANELTDSDIFTRQTTLYYVHVTYDWLADCEVDYYMNIAHAGDKEQQYLGKPMYEVGMTFMSAVFGSSDTWRVPVGELEYLLVDGTAYHIGTKAFITSEYIPSLIEEASETYFSAENNPMLFSSYVDAEALGEFIRTDWEARGFFEEKTTDDEVGIDYD